MRPIAGRGSASNSKPSASAGTPVGQTAPVPASEATEGELWAREQLAALLRARLTPRAIARFLWASQRRATRIRAERPEVAAREALYAAVGVAAWLVLAARGVEPFRRRLRSGLGGWALTVLMLDWHLGMLETEDGRLRNLGAADATTLLRAALVPAVADSGAAVLCALGFASDVVDGRLARAAEPTRLGRDLEGLVDAIFFTAALRGARRAQHITRVAASAELMRLGIGVSYAVAVYFARAQPPSLVLLHAARVSTPVRALGLILAGAGHRRMGSGLLLAGSVTGAASVLAGARLVAACRRLRT